MGDAPTHVPAVALDGVTAAITAAAEGGVQVMAFAKTTGSHFYTIWLSSPREVETRGRTSQLGWDTPGGTAARTSGKLERL